MTSPIIQIKSLNSPWTTIDPFLVCAHHVDNYPQGNSEFGPERASLALPLGQNTERNGDWHMYFGRTVPGFPAHPHRGFETITIVRKGVVDHADSLGNAARFGQGDVQWLTAGRGIVHSEMFPLLNQDRPNPLELFQIWLNLPAQSKMVAPKFKMLWADDIPVQGISDANGRIEVRYIVGKPEAVALASPPAPPVDSWANDPSADLAIWTIKLSAGAKWTLPPASGSRTRRQLYFFEGESMSINGHGVDSHSVIEVRCSEPVELVNGPTPTEILMLQGSPIGEPIVQEGPFVMNSHREIQQAYYDFNLTQFGHWNWPRRDPVHSREMPNFESHQSAGNVAR